MKRSLILTALSFLVLGQISLAQVAPQTVSYQGVLKDASGNLLSGDYDVIFTLYDNIDNPVWSEMHLGATANPVTVIDGVFSVILGKSTPFTGIENPPVELGIKVGADAEMIPRVELTSVIYALHADRSDTSEYAQKAGEVSGTANVFPGSGFVGIGTTTPSQKLDVDGTVIANGFALNNLNTKISSLTTDNIDLITNNAARVRVDPSGNVGIGTLAPSAKLEVAGDASVLGNLDVQGTITQGAPQTEYYSFGVRDATSGGTGGSYNYVEADTMMGMSLNLTIPLHLPHGATIIGITIVVDDNAAAADATCSLYSMLSTDFTLLESSLTPIGTVSTTSTGQRSTSATLATPHTVANQAERFWLRITSGEITIGGNYIRFYGGYITYTVN